MYSRLQPQKRTTKFYSEFKERKTAKYRKREFGLSVQENVFFLQSSNKKGFLA